jgi:hypothetical protein
VFLTGRKKRVRRRGISSSVYSCNIFPKMTQHNSQK